MTKTALANRELNAKKSIEREKLLHDTDQQALNRQQRENESVRSAKAQLWSSAIGALGRMGGSIGGAAIKANDPAFYKGYIPNLQDFVNVPHFDRLGNGKFAASKHLVVGYNSVEDEYTYDPAGILVFNYLPTVGSQTSDSNYYRNAVNQVLARMKEKVLSLNSRSSVSWESGDLGFNIFSSTDIMTQILELGRVVKVYQTYHSKNAYLARSLVSALGWDWSDIDANFAEYRKTYDVLAKRFNSCIVLPIELGLIKRRAYLATNVFVDSNETGYPRQMYAFVEEGALTLTVDGDSCSCHKMSSERSKITFFKQYIETMISNISDNPDFNEMYQDLRHAFSGSLVSIEESVTDTTIAFNGEALNREQIHNLEVVPMYATAGVSPKHMYPSISGGSHYTGFDLCQDSSGYLYQGKYNASPHGHNYRCVYCDKSDVFSGGIEPQLDKIESLFNMHKEDVTGDDIIDITRLRYHYTVDTIAGESVNHLTFAACGTEVVISAAIWVVESNQPNDPEVTSFPYSTFIAAYANYDDLGTYSDSIIDWKLYLAKLTMISNFDWAPITVYHEEMDIIGSTYTHRGIFIDTHTTFTISEKELKSIHEACVLGELFVSDKAYKSSFR